MQPEIIDAALPEPTDRVESFRRDYRSRHVGDSYQGHLHLGFTIVTCLLVIIVCLMQLDGVSARELLTIPITFLYANLVEYFGHRGPMHHPWKGLRLIFERHVVQHHRFFRDDAMAFDDSRDFKAVLFPPVLIVFYLVGFALPAGLLLAWLTSPNTAYLFAATAVAYFLNYELLHFAYHTRQGSWIGRLPLMSRLRRLHTLHHRPDLMQKYNFNITYPIGDWLFGTLFRRTDRANVRRR
ncbi:MAG: sterol desaturase family protein [Gammaproteobacteria bacterium]|nr:MAG: sterol desaturase family protein [Gammaproteobacteria bacterium]